MITIEGKKYDISGIISEYDDNSTEYVVLEKIDASDAQYAYDYVEQLKFELKVRGETPKAAIALKSGGMSFAVFEKSKCNADFWIRTDNGGFKLKPAATPSEAITDIYENGYKYATECATAITIIYYKALLTVYGEDEFNKIFPSIYLMDWDIREPLLAEVVSTFKADDVLIGDRGYFKNPDYNRETPQWQGENVIVMPDDMYWGHGIGYAEADFFISTLNSRREDNPSVSAYFMSETGRPNFKNLADALHKTSKPMLTWRPFPAVSNPVSSSHTHPGVLSKIRSEISNIQQNARD